MQRNIFAYTEPTPESGYPALISINSDGALTITVSVRSRDGGGDNIGTIAMSPENIVDLQSAIAEYIRLRVEQK